jgi:hypothetical protein
LSLPLLLSSHSERSEESPCCSNLQRRPRGSPASPSALEPAQATPTGYIFYETALIWSDRVKFRDAHLGLLLLVELFEDRAGSGRSSLCDG